MNNGQREVMLYLKYSVPETEGTNGDVVVTTSVTKHTTYIHELSVMNHIMYIHESFY